MNLTAIKEPAEVVDKHLLDSLAVLPHLHGLRIADIGTRRGLSGPAARDRGPRPALHARGIDRERRLDSCGMPSAMLRLPNVEVVQGRAEAFKPRKPFDSVIARALGSLADFVRVAGHLAGRGGRLLAMKGRPPEDELKALPAGWKALAVHPIRVPG